MKKTRFMVLSLIVSFMMLGIGYAAWNDTLLLSNTVTTGDLSVEFQSDTISSSFNSSDYVVPKILNSTSKSISLSIDNLYPGAFSLYTAKAVNTGTIPAVFDTITVNLQNTSDIMRQSLLVAGGFVIKSGQTQTDNGYFIGTLSELQTNLNNQLKNKRLNPGESISLEVPSQNLSSTANNLSLNGQNIENCMIFSLPLTSDNTTKKQSASFTINFNFKQHNN